MLERSSLQSGEPTGGITLARDAATERQMGDKGDFFSIGRDTFIRACNGGVNAAAAFLVMARGTGGDNVTTRWSAEAISQRLGVRWGTGREAVRVLKDANVAKAMDETANRPTYKLEKAGDAIWMPNTIVDGAGGELAPVLKLRQTQDAMAVRLFGELYGSQNLREDGGISRNVTYKKFKRERIGQRGAQVVWNFTLENTYVNWCDVTRPHQIARLSKEEIDAGQNKARDYFRRAQLLETAGLIEWIPYLFEGDSGEPIHPLAWNGLEMERELYQACRSAAEALLTEEQRTWLAINRESGWLVPVPAHIEQVTMVGIARLRYRPHTKMTAAWWAEYGRNCAQFTTAYRAMAELKKAA
jgi:hypothetical protein